MKSISIVLGLLTILLLLVLPFNSIYALSPTQCVYDNTCPEEKCRFDYWPRPVPEGACELPEKKESLKPGIITEYRASIALAGTIVVLAGGYVAVRKIAANKHQRFSKQRKRQK